MNIKSKKESDKQYYEDNKEVILERQNQYYKDNTDKCNESKRNYYANNKVKCNERDKKYRDNNKEKIKKVKKEYTKTHKKETKNLNLKRCYGITIEQYNQMFNVQEGKCKVCGKHQSELYQPLGVDHNHTTGKVRGLLCPNCNSILGHAKDNTDTLQKVIIYLKEND